MNINIIICSLIACCFFDANCLDKEEMFEIYKRYLKRLETISGNSLAPIQRQELEKARTIKDYNQYFFGTAKYKKRREYQDISKETLIAMWKIKCPEMHWESDQEIHHVIPLGYGGKNEWWNIFPLTSECHLQNGIGIHSSKEFKTLFPEATTK